MFSSDKKPKDYIVIIRLRTDKKISIYISDVISDNHLWQEIRRLRNHLDFQVVSYRPVLMFNMVPPDQITGRIDLEKS